MPNPHQDESRNDFIARCIPIVIDDGTAADGSQGAAVCGSMYDNAKEKGIYDEQDEKGLQGLYLADPHGPLIWDGAKRAVAKSSPSELSGSWVLVGPGFPGAADPGKAYGIVKLSAPVMLDLKSFDEAFDAHRVSKAERKRWWPGVKSLYIHMVEEFRKWDPPREVRVPQGVRETIKDLTYTGNKSYLYRRPVRDTVIAKDFVQLGGSGEDVVVSVKDQPGEPAIEDLLTDVLPAHEDGSLIFAAGNGNKQQPVADLVLRWKRGQLVEDEKGFFPTSERGLTATETMIQVHQMGGKFSQMDANYIQPTEDPYEACGGCRFFIRDEHGELGSCAVVAGIIAWFGECDNHISAEREALATLTAIYTDQDGAKAVQRRINLSGADHTIPGYLNIDSKEGEGVDLTWDVTVGLPLPSDQALEVLSIQQLHTIPAEQRIPLIREIHRVLAPQAVFRFEDNVPKTDVPGDEFRIDLISIDTFKAFTNPTLIKAFGLPRFDIIDLDLIPNDDDTNTIRGTMRKVVTEEETLVDLMNLVEVETIGKAEKPFKTLAGVRLHQGDYASVGDPNEPATWKLPLGDQPGKIDPFYIAGSITSMQPGGYRGHPVKLTAPKTQVVKRIQAAIAKLEDPEQREHLTERLAAVKAGTKQDKPSKKVDGVDLHAEDFASVGDAKEPGTWKLPITKTAGGVDEGRIAAAITAMQPGGFRGQRVQLTAPKDQVVRKIRAAIGRLDDEDAQDRLSARLDNVKEVAMDPGAKGGRRLRADRTSALRQMRDEFAGLLQKLGEFVGWADYQDKQPWMPFRSVKVFTDRDGNKGLVVWTTNAFKDRDDEIFSTKSIEDFVDRHAKDDDKGDFWFWHIPGSKFATIKAQGMVGRFLVEAGPFDDTPVGRAFEKLLSEYPHGHPSISPEGWGASHGYVFDPEDRKDGVYEWFEKKESSVLPGSVAANPFNPSMEVFEMDAKAIASFREVVGDDELVDSLLETGEKLTAALEGQGVDHKARASLVDRIAKAAEGIDNPGVSKQVTALAKKLAAILKAGHFDMFGKPEHEEDESSKDEAAKAVGEIPDLVAELETLAGEAGGSPELLKIAGALEGVGDETPAPEEKAGEGDGDEEGEPETEADPEPEPAAEAEAEAAGDGDGEAEEKEFATVEQLDDIGDAIKVMATQIGTLTDTVKALVVDEDERLTEQLNETPFASLKALAADRVVGSSAARIRKNNKLAKAGPEETEPTGDDNPMGTGVPVLERLKQLNQRSAAQRYGGD